VVGGIERFGIGERTPVVELEAAPAAVEELAFTGDSLQEIKEAGVHPVDAVGVFQFDNAEGTTNRTAGPLTQMVPVPPWGKLLPLTCAALIDRHVAKAFPERAVDAPQLSSTLPTLHLLLFISQFAEEAQAERE
jgi:hypothetical protein